jgi:hypothetical protein
MTPAEIQKMAYDYLPFAFATIGVIIAWLRRGKVLG